MATAGGKKQKKVKGKTMALTDFLQDDQAPGTSYVLANRPVSWATEMENCELDETDAPEYGVKSSGINRAALPTAPKAARGPDIDLNRVPSDPPFTAYIGNLAYETTEDRVMDFFKQLQVVNVRLPADRGRLKGFGYVEFATREMLIDALTKNDETFHGRKLRVDLASGNQQGDRENRGQGREDDNRSEVDNWRRKEPDSDASSDRYDSRYSDRNRDRGYNDRYGDRDRDRGFGDRGGDRSYNDRGGDRSYNDRGYSDRGNDRGYSDRGSDRGYNDRVSDRGYNDRGSDRGYNDRGSDRGGGFSDRGGGFSDRGGGFSDRGGDRGYNDSRSGYGDRSRYGDRDGYNRGGSRDRVRGRDGESSFGRDRGFNRDNRFQGGNESGGYSQRSGGSRGGFDSGPRSNYGGENRYDRPQSRDPSGDAPKERPKLQLQPRSKPVDDNAANAKSSSIFGNAKPVDTAAREREIEEKLLKQHSDDKKKIEEEKENRFSEGRRSMYTDIRREMPNPPPTKREIITSDDSSRRSEEAGSKRERKLSSSSGKSGRSVPPPVSQGKPRRDSETSNHSEASHVTDDSIEAPKTPTSPQHREDPSKLVPAPPPKENPWERRKAQTSPSSPVSPQNSSVSQNMSSSQTPTRSTTQGNAWSRGRPDVGGPKSPESNQGRGERSDLGRGRGGRRDWGGRGRGGGKSSRGREHQVPQSIEEMPKFQEKSQKDWSDKNKFSYLLDDNEDVEAEPT